MKRLAKASRVALLGALFCLTAAARAQAVQIAGVPFAATQVITRSSPEGTQRTEGRVARNAAGSTYVEEVDPATGKPCRALIFDVTHRRVITLDLTEHRYTVQPVPHLRARTVPVGWVGDQLRWAEAHRNHSEREVKGNTDSIQTWLGTRQVSGLLTIGTVKERRPVAATISTSTREPALEIDESWFSVELGMSVLMTEQKPRAGETVEVLLTGILRAEPESSLFKVPEGFRPQASTVPVPAPRPLSSSPSDGL